MSTAQKLCTLAFAGLALLSGGQVAAQPAGAPTRVFPQLMVDVARNSYSSEIASLPTSRAKIYEVVNCTSGLVITTQDYSNSQSLSPIGVAQLTPKAQELIRANCNSHGLRAGF